jgi:tRNA threonylcarbamoyladenosine biosynthesis protein TsaB
MKILAVDTATTSCSVAIIETASPEADAPISQLAETTLVSKTTHSKHLMKLIDAVIKNSGIQSPEIDGFAVAKGPGSFTGLRIGISTVKGLALASRKPVVGVSNLDALAYPLVFSPYLICVLIDARKGEVYRCCYRSDETGHLKKETREHSLSPEDAIADIHEPCLFVGNGACLYQKMIKEKKKELAYFVPHSQNILHASIIACLSLERFRQGDTDDVALLTPRYIRKSDAELPSLKL